jgi:hypothetical protein
MLRDSKLKGFEDQEPEDTMYRTGFYLSLII